jgi:hypothetical protein
MQFLIKALSIHAFVILDANMVGATFTDLSMFHFHDLNVQDKPV